MCACQHCKTTRSIRFFFHNSILLTVFIPADVTQQVQGPTSELRKKWSLNLLTINFTPGCGYSMPASDWIFFSSPGHLSGLNRTITNVLVAVFHIESNKELQVSLKKTSYACQDMSPLWL